jgi:hypothetical protein
MQYAKSTESAIREAAILALGFVGDIQSTLPFLMNIKDNDTEAIIRERAKYAAYDLIENKADIITLSDYVLIFAVNSHHWNSQKLASQQLYIRKNIEGIDLARNQIIWPYIKQLTWSEPAETSSLEYKRIIEIGEIAQVPLMENLKNTKAQTNTRKWSGRLLCHVGVFDEIIDELLKVIKTAETGGRYSWWHKVEVQRGMPTLFARQTTDKLNELLNHADPIVVSYATAELNKRTTGKSAQITGTQKLLEIEIEYSKTPAYSTEQEAMRDNAMYAILDKINATPTSAVGGIDMNNIDIDRNSNGREILFNNDALMPMLDLDTTGFIPVIIHFAPLNSVLPLLGLNDDEEKDNKQVIVQNDEG